MPTRQCLQIEEQGRWGPGKKMATRDIPEWGVPRAKCSDPRKCRSGWCLRAGWIEGFVSLMAERDMNRRLPVFLVLIAMLAALPAWGQASFGTRVIINGQSSDLALDESRNSLYVANFAGRRIDVVDLTTLQVQRSINLDLNQPSSLSISPDARYLLVAHFGNTTAPGTSSNGLTLIDLSRDTRRTFSLNAAPLGVAFGIDGRALIATATNFQSFDPATGTSTIIRPIAGLTPTVLPVTVPNQPATITRASLTTSGDGLRIAGLTDTFRFVWNVTRRDFDYLVFYTSTPLQAPRAVSLSRDGSKFLSGWVLLDLPTGRNAQFPSPGGDLDRGSHIIDTNRGRIYAQIRGEGEPANSGPNNRVLQVLDLDNLALLQRLRLPENLTGKSIISPDGNRVYSLSESGVVVLPVGDLDRARRLEPSSSLISFRGNFCDRTLMTREVTIRDTSGQRTSFSLSTTTPGVTFTPASGMTPMNVRITVDPNRFLASKGTSLVDVAISSNEAVNLASPLRLAINMREPDQRGTVVELPGQLVAIQGDPSRNRFYILRQDFQDVLVFDGSNMRQIGRLTTGTTPTSLAMTFDRTRLLIGHDNAQYIEVYNLDTLERDAPILSPFGHYPRQIASSASRTLVANRVAGTINVIDEIDFTQRRAVELSSLGPWRNDISEDTAAVSSDNGSSIFLAQNTGRAYHFKDGEFVAIREFTGETFSGAIAGSNFDRFTVGPRLLNGSLTQEMTLANGGGTITTGVSLGASEAIVTSASAVPGDPGYIARVNLETGELIRPTRLVEAPTRGASPSVFVKNLAVLPGAIVMLSTSGFLVLPPNYDEATAPPRINQVVNAADFTAPIAPGGLITIFGERLSPATLASGVLPLPTVLADSCLQVNGLPVPFLFVSGGQINAQLPAQAVGAVSLILRTPGGVSDTFRLSVAAGAPSVFRSASDGSRNDLPTIIRVDNGLPVTGSNPIRRNGRVLVYLTGLGRTSPEVADGAAAPSDPLARVVLPPTVTIGGTSIPVEFAGLSPGSVGVYQINLFIPDSVPVGLDVPLTITQGTNSTTVSVRVVR